MGYAKTPSIKHIAVKKIIQKMSLCMLLPSLICLLNIVNLLFVTWD